MAFSKLAILIETVNKGKGTKDATKDLGALEDQAGKTTNKTGGMSVSLGDLAIAAGVAGAALYAAKKAFDLGAEGAQILRTRDVFDRLSESIGETADVMMGKLRDATMGMVSDTDLMQSSARLVSMGLASTADEAAKLSEIAVTLGAAMGKQATPAMEEFALMLANQSTLRLDTFGISAGKVKERIIELTDTIPGMTRETAFMQATMEQAEISMANLGDAIKPDEYAQATAEVENLKDEFKMLTSKALNPAVKAMGSFLREARELREELARIEKAGVALDRLARAAGLTEKEYSKLLDTVIEMSEGHRDADTIMRREELALKALESGLRLTTKGAVTYAIAQDEANNTAENMERIWRRVSDRGEEYADTVGDVTDEISDWERAQDTLNSSLMDSWQRVDGLVIKTGELQTATEDVKQPVIDLYGATGELATRNDSLAEAVNRVKLELYGIPLPADEAATAFGRAAYEMWAEANKAANEVKRINDELDELDGRDVHATVYIDRMITEQLATPVTDPDRLGGPAGHAGMDFVVPPGYPNDSYPMRVESGEHVQVTPAGQSPGGNTVNVTVYTGSGNPDLIGNKVAGRVAEVLGVRG